MAQSSEIIKNRSCWAMIDRSINKSADSLNFINRKAQLPAYLEDHSYDWRYKDRLYPCTKNPLENVSFRKAIIDRVTREDVLEWIIFSSNKAYDKCYIPDSLKKVMGIDAQFESFPDLPYMDKSWRDLAEIRLEEVREKKKTYAENE